MVQKILVGIDFSANSRAALARAVELGNLLGVPVTALHVVEHPSVATYAMYAPMSDPTWFHEAKPKAGLLMDEWLEPFPGSHKQILTGSAAEVLIGAADNHTLLVLGHVGHSALERFLFGSTASKVVRHAPCDVLVVRSATA